MHRQSWVLRVYITHLSPLGNIWSPSKGLPMSPYGNTAALETAWPNPLDPYIYIALYSAWRWILWAEKCYCKLFKMIVNSICVRLYLLLLYLLDYWLDYNAPGMPCLTKWQILWGLNIEDKWIVLACMLHFLVIQIASIKKDCIMFLLGICRIFKVSHSQIGMGRISILLGHMDL